MRTSPHNATVLCWMFAISLLASCASPTVQPKPAAQPVRLLSPLPFDRFTKTGPITRSEAMSLLHEKVKVGSNDPDANEFLALPTPKATNLNPAEPPPLPAIGKRVRIETVAEYLAALKQGAGAFTTWDQVMDSRFYPTAGIVKFLSQAVESRRSSLPVKLLEQLPVSILSWPDSDKEREFLKDAAKGITLRHYSRAGKLQKFESTATTLTFESPIKTYALYELARGDFNGDGFEDSLVAVHWHYLEGTGLGYDVLLVQRVEGKPLTVQPFPPR